MIVKRRIHDLATPRTGAGETFRRIELLPALRGALGQRVQPLDRVGVPTTGLARTSTIPSASQRRYA